MSGGIFLLRGDNDLVEMIDTPYDSEKVLQMLLGQYPNLLAGDQVDLENPRRWILVKREISLPAEEQGIGRWFLDHLFVDQDGIPTLIEVKRSTDARIRREVVGQMLDYAANASRYLPTERLRPAFEASCLANGKEPQAELERLLGAVADPDEFWGNVYENLRDGRIRLVFVADIMPLELRTIIEFLNQQMNPAEVLGIEIRQYMGQGLTTLVPRVIGQTAVALQRKERRPTQAMTWDILEQTLPPANFEVTRTLYDRIEAAVSANGYPWKPAIRNSYMAFYRSGNYAVVSIEFYSTRPVNFGIKLPGSPADMGVLNPYPHLQDSWVPTHRQWNWAIPTVDAIPDLSAAIELTAKYQPPSGPMAVWTGST